MSVRMKICAAFAAMLMMLCSNVKGTEMCKKVYIQLSGHVLPDELANQARVAPDRDRCKIPCRNWRVIIIRQVIQSLRMSSCMDRIRGPLCGIIISARGLLSGDELSVFQRTIEDLEQRDTQDPRTAYGLPATYPSSARPFDFFRCWSCGLSKYKQKSAKIGNFRTVTDQTPRRCFCQFLFEYPQITAAEIIFAQACDDNYFLALHQIGGGWQVNWAEIRPESNANGDSKTDAVASTSSSSPDFTIDQHMVESFACGITALSRERMCRWPERSLRTEITFAAAGQAVAPAII